MSLTRLKPTGVNSTAQFTLANLSVQGNAAAGNIKTDNILYANGVSWDFKTYPVGSNTQIAFNDNGIFGANANLTFNKSTKTLTTDNIITSNVTGTIRTASQPQITSLGTLTSLSVTNDTSVGGNVTITGNLTVSGTTTTINSTVIEVADTALVLARNATTAVQANGAGIIINGAGANLTYNSTSNAFVSTHKISADGSLLSALNGSNITGRVANANVAYTVANAAQPNITSVGTLTGLVVNGEIVGQVLTAPSISGTLVEGSNAQPNITSVGTLISLNVTGNITSGNIVTANVFSGNANLLNNINASNITSGTISSARLSGAYSISVTSATTAGTVTTAAQPNITSVGTLLNTTMGSTNSFTGGNLVSATYLTGTLTTSAQPNITSTGTLTSVAVSGNANVGNLNSSGRVVAADNLIINSTTSEGGQLVIAHAGVTGVTGQANSTWNMDVDSSNTLRFFSQSSSGAVTTPIAYYANGNANFPNNLSVGSNLAISSWLLSGQATESLNSAGAVASSTVNYNLSTGATFYHSSVTLGANWTANIQNVPTTDSKTIVVTIMVVQGTTPYIPNVLQIDGTAQTIKWSSGITPVGRASAVDIFSFGLIRAGAAWAQVLGSYTSYS